MARLDPTAPRAIYEAPAPDYERPRVQTQDDDRAGGLMLAIVYGLPAGLLGFLVGALIFYKLGFDVGMGVAG